MILPRYVFSILIVFILSSSAVNASQFFVSTKGSDSNPGTIDLPFLTLTKAFSLSNTVFKPGDTLYVRGGTYQSLISFTFSKSGADSAYYHIYSYPGERVILDFSGMSLSSSNRGVNFKGSYCHFRGFEIKGAGDNGMLLSGSNNIIENCAFYDNRDSGLQLSSGAANNRIINCDSYYNADPPDYGDADGFAVKMDVGTGNYFYGCRAWLNSDDGWDGYMRGANNVSTTVENCWAFKNGYFKNGADAGANANGNGFKMGGSDDKTLIHDFKVVNSLAFMNKLKGFDQNNNKGSMILYNCTGYANVGQNYSIPSTLAAGKVAVLKNCAELGKKISLFTGSEQITNSWQLNPVAANSDFISIDTANFGGATAPRKADSSLPDLIFMHLSPNSKLIDVGTNIQLPFNGKAPDLGCFETGGTVGVLLEQNYRVHDFELGRNFPNPFNPVTNIYFTINKPGNITIKVFDIQGKEIATLYNGYKNAGRYNIIWDASNLSSGVYFCSLVTEMGSKVQKMVLAK